MTCVKHLTSFSHKLCLYVVSQLEECSLQLAPNGNYLDLDSSLLEQRDELESFYEDVM